SPTTLPESFGNYNRRSRAPASLSGLPNLNQSLEIDGRGTAARIGAGERERDLHVDIPAARLRTRLSANGDLGRLRSRTPDLRHEQGLPTEDPGEPVQLGLRGVRRRSLMPRPRRLQSRRHLDFRGTLDAERPLARELLLRSPLVVHRERVPARLQCRLDDQIVT